MSRHGISLRPDRDLIAVTFAGSLHKQIRIASMPVGNPMSFGHSEALGTLAEGWAKQTTANYGVLLKAKRLGAGSNMLPGDQHVHFLKQAVLRLTFEREGQ